MTLFITHRACHDHLTPADHPERSDRLRAIEQVLEHEKFTFLLRQQCPRAELEIVALCHPWEHIERIRRAVPQTGLVHLDDDTVLSAGSFEACLRAAGGAILAVDEVMSGKAKTRSSRSARPNKMPNCARRSQYALFLKRQLGRSSRIDYHRLKARLLLWRERFVGHRCIGNTRYLTTGQRRD
jgi:Histone deacetylase domain